MVALPCSVRVVGTPGNWNRGCMVAVVTTFTHSITCDPTAQVEVLLAAQLGRLVRVPDEFWQAQVVVGVAATMLDTFDASLVAAC